MRCTCCAPACCQDTPRCGECLLSGQPPLRCGVHDAGDSIAEWLLSCPAIELLSCTPTSSAVCCCRSSLSKLVLSLTLACSASMLLTSAAKLLLLSDKPCTLSEYMWCSLPVWERRDSILPAPLPLLRGLLPPRLLTSWPGFAAAGMERLPRLVNVSFNDSWMFLNGWAAVLPILAISLYSPVEVMLPGILQQIYSMRSWHLPSSKAQDNLVTCKLLQSHQQLLHETCPTADAVIAVLGC